MMDISGTVKPKRKSARRERGTSPSVKHWLPGHSQWRIHGGGGRAPPPGRGREGGRGGERGGGEGGGRERGERVGREGGEREG